MGADMNYIDIVFFAMVAVFLVLRLRSVLGRRTGNERPPRIQNGQPGNGQDWSKDPARPDGPIPDTVIDLAAARKSAGGDLVPAANGAAPGPAGLAAIRAVDPTFAPDDFLAGCRMAFEMIVGAYAAGDRRVLRPLLSDEVYRNFSGAIEARQAAGERLDNTLVGIRALSMLDARVDGPLAMVTVRFVSDQVNVLRDGQDRIVEGAPGRASEVIDEWTFQRDVRLKDPNWVLVATRSPEA
jgi:predicted lipid-binding transport protein (Tim44 family)